MTEKGSNDGGRMMTYKGMWQKQSFFLECDKVKSKAKVGERCSEQFSKKEEVRMLWQFLPLLIIVQYN